MTPALGKLVSPLRASDMPLAFICPGSVRAPKVPARDYGELADLGSAAHEALRPLAEGGGIEWETIPGIAVKWGVDETELRVLVALGYQLWQGVRDQFPEAVTEVALASEIEEGVTLSGHLDILSVASRVARIGDWKTGRVDHDYRHQLMCYAVLVLLDDQTIDEVVFKILWVREREVEPYRFTRADAQAWLERLRSHVVQWDGVYRAGPHCVHCRCSHECKSANALARRDSAVLLDAEGVDLEKLTPDEVIALYRKAKVFAAISERVVKTIKARVEKFGDVVGATEGKLTTSVEGRRTVDVAKAVPLLIKKGFTPQEIERVTKLSMSEIESVAAEKAGRGKGSAAVREIAAEFEKAGAVSERTFTKLNLKR